MPVTPSGAQYEKLQHTIFCLCPFAKQQCLFVTGCLLIKMRWLPGPWGSSLSTKRQASARSVCSSSSLQHGRESRLASKRVTEVFFFFLPSNLSCMFFQSASALDIYFQKHVAKLFYMIKPKMMWHHCQGRCQWSKAKWRFFCLFVAFNNWVVRVCTEKDN